MSCFALAGEVRWQGLVRFLFLPLEAFCRTMSEIWFLAWRLALHDFSVESVTSNGDYKVRAQSTAHRPNRTILARHHNIVCSQNTLRARILLRHGSLHCTVDQARVCAVTGVVRKPMRAGTRAASSPKEWSYTLFGDDTRDHSF